MGAAGCSAQLKTGQLFRCLTIDLGAWLCATTFENLDFQQRGPNSVVHLGTCLDLIGYKTSKHILTVKHLLKYFAESGTKELG